MYLLRNRIWDNLQSTERKYDFMYLLWKKSYTKMF